MLITDKNILKNYNTENRLWQGIPGIAVTPKGRIFFDILFGRYSGTKEEIGNYAAVCNDPDADEIVWSKERVIGKDVMMNKPTVISTGEWLFPIAV